MYNMYTYMYNMYRRTSLLREKLSAAAAANKIKRVRD